ncbi:MAG: HAMP domain-containing histidine kinase [Lachnospiraceae bacterium]|nr:HAMP domain-containing histidine kinase [Lachnospiraceae bacterium]
MLGKLRVQFVLAATLALLMAFILVMVPVYFIVSNSFSAQIELILDMLLDNEGDMPGHRALPAAGGLIRITTEQQYETRYFSVKLRESGAVAEVNTREIMTVDQKAAADLAKELLRSGKASGRYQYGESIFLYKSRYENGERLYVFVDCTSRLWIIEQVMTSLITASLIILLVFSLTLGALSSKIVEPFIENSERQKRFITNASHELKTPLAIISANNEMVELENGGSKWTDSTMRQVKRLNSLISELVTLSKLDEKDEIVLSNVEASSIVKEQAEAFEQVVLQQGKSFEKDIAEDVVIKAESRSVQELCSILLDNSAKYCDDGGIVKVEFSSKGKGARLAVTNSYAAGANVDYRRFFDRFYREDESHNSKKGGFGIGLSIAQEIVRRLGAKIQVSYKSGEITFIILFR